MPLVAVPKDLSEKLGDKGSKDFVNVLEIAYDMQKTDIIELVEQKFEAKLTREISRLELTFTQEIAKLEVKVTQRIENVKTELRTEISKLDVKLSKEIANVKSELKTEISKLDVKIESVKSEIIKWMFVFWVGLFASMGGLMYLLLKLMLDK